MVADSGDGVELLGRRGVEERVEGGEGTDVVPAAGRGGSRGAGVHSGGSGGR